MRLSSVRRATIRLCALLFFTLAMPIQAVSSEPAPGINPELAAHSRHYAKKVYKVGENVYSAVGWNIANIVMIEGDDGIILVDAGLSPQTSAEVMEEFRKITDKPIVAVIYSHFHHDHIDGIKGLVTAEQVKSGEVAIYSHATLMDNLVGESTILGPILGVRAGYSFGFFLKGAEVEQMNAGIGPLPTGGRPGTFIAPTKLVDDYLKVTIAGVELEIFHVPSEAPDELAVWLPGSKILIDTEVLQGPAFPNMHSLRGTKFRDPVRWVDSIDLLRRLKAENLVPTHGQPVYGAEKTEEVLRMTRDGIQYVHDQTVRHMNKGLTPDELVQVVKLPEHLAAYKPYLRQYYGTVKQAVRQIYVGYLGWFEGDPVGLDPVPEGEKANRLVQLMGGHDRVLKLAGQSLAEGDPQWAAELATYLIRIDNADAAARNIKAEAFRSMGYASMNVNWRNWYLTSAHELDGTLDGAMDAKKMASVFMPPDIITEIPAGVSLKSWGARLKSEETLAVDMSLGFEFSDLGKSYSLTIRRGVCQFDSGPLDQVDLQVRLTRAQFDTILLEKTSLVELVSRGEITLSGQPEELRRFLGYFEPAGGSAIALTVH
jgi:alkyl sulfatase BDS1-like metallo-beta-lactamase superfamily hydrolase